MGRRPIDLTGNKYGDLIVLRKSEKKTKDNRLMWLCECKCGNIKSIRPASLRNGDTRSCGCKQGNPSVDLTGKQFERLTVVTEVGRDKHRNTLWKCRCECGSLITAPTNNLNSGNTKSCGCYEIDIARERAKERMIGKVFGRLTVISLSVGVTNLLWECSCSCGGKALVRTADLNNGHTRSCGCLQKEKVSESSRIDLLGRKFGRLTVIELTGESVSYESGNMLKWLCKCDCGKHTKLFTSTITTGNTRSCGCLAKEMVGEKSPVYNPYKTNEERLMGRYKLGGRNAKSWRKQVFKRDNYTCVVCNQYGGTLNAHHLDGWGWCRERRFDLSNGVTLCAECHTKYHRIYGKKNNTEKQFNQYLSKARTLDIEQSALF